MKWTKKYFRVNAKIARKKFTSKPHYFVVSLAFVSILSFAFYTHHKNNQPSRLSTFTAWQIVQKDIAKRSPAGLEANNTCQYNHIDLVQLKSEIKELEQKYQTGSTIEGKFHGLDLTTLPSIGAQMLADHKNLIGNRNEELDFSKCQGSIPCVFNSIYNDQSKLSGYFVYYWYLKTGSMLSLSNFIPNQKSIEAGEYSRKKHSYNSYLFNQEELKSFYFLAKSLPEKLTFIPLLKSIHKIPVGAKIEGYSSDICSLALPNGQILLGYNCLKGERKKFNLVVTKEIAKFADRHEGLKVGKSDLSSQEEWINFGDWHKESYFNPVQHVFEYRWKNKIQPEYVFDMDLKRSPSEHFATSVAHFRFNPNEFKVKVSNELREWIKDNIFNGLSYDSEGVYKQYINQSLDIWARQEVPLWKNCLDQHLENKDITELQRDLANSLEHPLYACVEKKIPSFVNFLQNKIQKENYEGCKFFNDQGLSHIAKRFDRNIKKYLVEKILQRKIEIQKHGTDVLTGQLVIADFIKNVDPKAVYVSCFSKKDIKKCYHKEIKSKLDDILKNYTATDYYKGVIREDTLALYPFDYVKRKTNEAAKLFLAPFSARLHQAANKMWNTCKEDGTNAQEELKLPMKFSGGRYYINPKLINCINSKVETQLMQLAELKAFQYEDSNRIEFKLNKAEKHFALSFMEGKLLQTLNNILDEEYFSEKQRFNQYFKEIRLSTVQTFEEDEELMTNVFSHQQVENLCMQKVANFYPENYFYHSKPQMDKTFGRSICSKFVTQPNINKTLQAQFRQQWLNNRSVAEGYLTENYKDLVDKCYSEFEGRKMSHYRSICIKDAFDEAIGEAIMDWRDHEHYKHYMNREKEVVEYFVNNLKFKLIQKATESPESIIRQPAQQ